MTSYVDKDYVKKLLSDRWPTAEDLRKEFPGLKALLQGEFEEGKFNTYIQEPGVVVSRPLNQGITKNPTIGIIWPGKYSFETGENIETMTVLDGGDGGMNARVPKSSFDWIKLKRYGSIMVPAGDTLELDVIDSFVYYLCQYKPKINF
jgi:uncharacterized protein YaiE (UPF0345 family)